MSQEVTGIISWLRSWFDDIYAPKGSGGTITLDDIYPVGSIYMTVDNTKTPAQRFGGTWVQLTGTFLYASTTADANSTTATGGEATHTLTIDEIPSHRHEASVLARYLINGSGNALVGYGASTNHQSTSYVGGGQAHNNMPPYMKVYMWKRTG